MRLTVSRIFRVLAIYGIIIFTGCSRGAEVIPSHYTGYTGSSGAFQSPGYPQSYQLNSTIYEYHLTNLNPAGYVQVVFTDFLLNENSVLYIYDVDESNHTVHSSLFSRGDRPIYQSKYSSLRVAFKTGTGESTSDYTGFIVEFTFVNYTRVRWMSYGIPSVGICGEIIKLDAESGISATGWFGDEYKIFTTCTWVISAGSEYHLLIQVPPDNSTPGDSSLRVTVRRGLSRLAPSYPTPAPAAGYIYAYTGSVFHIAVSGYLKRNDVVTIAYSPRLSSATDILRQIKTAPDNSTCAYKKCPRESSTRQCVLYWEPCQTAHTNSDSTCDRPEVIETCDSGARCFIPLADICDSYPDCRDKTDEADCGGDRPIGVTIAVATVISILVIALILAIAMCLLLRNRKKKNLQKQERRAQLSNVFSKGLCCSNVDKPTPAGSHSYIVNSPSGGSSRDGGVVNGGLQSSNMSLPSSQKGATASSVYTVQNGLATLNPTNGLANGATKDKSTMGYLNPLLSEMSSRASSIESLAKDQSDGLPNFEWLTFAPSKKKKRSTRQQRREAKRPATLILPRPVSFPSSIVVTSPGGCQQGEPVFTVESPPPSCEEIATFMGGTGLDPLSPMEDMRPRAQSLQPTARTVLQTSL